MVVFLVLGADGEATTTSELYRVTKVQKAWKEQVR